MLTIDREEQSPPKKKPGKKPLRKDSKKDVRIKSVNHNVLHLNRNKKVEEEAIEELDDSESFVQMRVEAHSSVSEASEEEKLEEKFLQSKAGGKRRKEVKKK